MDVPKEGGTPSQGKSAAGEEGGVCGVQGGEPCREKLQQLLEVEGAGIKGGGEEAERDERKGTEARSKGNKGAKGKGGRRRKSSEAHNVTSKSSMDEDRFRKGRHPQRGDNECAPGQQSNRIIHE